MTEEKSYGSIERLFNVNSRISQLKIMIPFTFDFAFLKKKTIYLYMV